ncbi:MAG TPA: hypothetical protein DIS76_06195, partial [Rhodospirillaceae bacterium]|nr:hypothetical protein [Rhodospirillaceae bacterium]
MQEVFEKFWQWIAPLARPMAERFEFVWNQGIAGHNVQNILIVLGIVILTLFIRGPIAWFLMTWLKN